MELVVDANIWIAALIREGVTRELLLDNEFILYTPEFIIDEFFKHMDMLEKKTCLSKEVLLELAKVLIIESNIIIIPKDEARAFLKKAQQISPDPDDVMYFATALKLQCSIWSNDKKLKDQNQIPVYSTHDLKKLF